MSKSISDESQYINRKLDTKIKVLRFSSQEVYNVKTFKKLDQLTYCETLKILINQKDSGRLKSWQVYMNDDLFEFEQFITDSPMIQNKWCFENNIKFLGCFETIIEQISITKPHFVFIHDYTFINEIKMAHLKSMFPTIKWITYWGIALDERKFNWIFLRLFDLVLTPVDSMKKIFDGNGFESELMTYGIIPQHTDIFHDFPSRRDEVLFAGSINLNLGGKGFGHYQRLFDVIKLAELNKKAIFHTNRQKVPSLYTVEVKNFYLALKRRWLLSFSGYNKFLADRVRLPLFGEDYFELLMKHKVIFNPQTVKHIGNIRFVESAFCGNVTITNLTDKSSLDNIFGVNNYLGYKTNDDLRNILNNLNKCEYDLQQMAINSRVNLIKYYDYYAMFDKIKFKLLKLYNSD
jgi:hypothetical protein